MPSDKETPQIQIHSGDEVKTLMGPRELQPFLEHWYNHTNSPETTIMVVRQHLRLLLESTIPMQYMSNGMRRSYYSLLDQISTLPPKRVRLADVQRYVQEIIQKGQLFVATQQEHIVGMLGYDKLPTQVPGEHDGQPPRDIYELRRASVLPAFEGQGTFAQLKAHAMEHIQTLDPNALILSVTKNETVKKANNRSGYQPIDDETLLRLRGCPPEFIAKNLEQMRQNTEGWEAFRLDPRAARDEE